MRKQRCFLVVLQYHTTYPLSFSQFSYNTNYLLWLVQLIFWWIFVPKTQNSRSANRVSATWRGSGLRQWCRWVCRGLFCTDSTIMPTVELGNHGNKTTSEETGQMSQGCLQKRWMVDTMHNRTEDKRGPIQKLSSPPWRSWRKTDTFFKLSLFISDRMFSKCESVNVVFGTVRS